MGVIQRQGLKSSIISYVGVAIGVVSTLFVYPHVLEIMGLFRSLYDAAWLLCILGLFGTSVSAVRFFPKYEDKASGHQGFLTMLLIWAGLGFGLILLLFPLIQRGAIAFIFDKKNSLYEDFAIYILPLTLFLVLINLLTRYISNFKRIVIPALFEQLAIKISIPLIMLMFLGGWLSVKGVVICIVLSFAFSAFGMIYYLYHLGEWQLTKPVFWKDKPARKEFIHYSFFGFLSGIGSQTAYKIDGIMVSGMIHFQAAGVYAIAWTLSEVIAKPMRALSAISGPMLAQFIEQNNLKEVENIYKKSALNMTIIGLGLFLLIWTVLPYIFTIMPNSDIIRQGTYVVFFLGLAQLWDMMTGVNNEIISYSKYYRFTLYLNLILGVVTIAGNLVFIPVYGLTGSALATCLSMFLFNVLKLFFVQAKFGIQPFSVSYLPAIGFCLAAWLIASALPATGMPWLDLMIKGGVFSLVYGMAIWKFKISPDINHWVDLGWKKLGIVLKMKNEK